MKSENEKLKIQEGRLGPTAGRSKAASKRSSGLTPHFSLFIFHFAFFTLS
jgi:hypothetical protein